MVPETGLAYVPIFGDGIHGRNPNPQHHLCVFDLNKRAHVGTIDLRPYIAPHTLKLGPGRADLHHLREQRGGGGDRPRRPTRWWRRIDSGSTNGHRLIISPDGAAALHRERGGRDGLGDRPAEAQAARQDHDPSPARRHRDLGRRRHAWWRSTTREPALFLIDTASRDACRDEVRLEGVPKAAQIARYAPDNSLLGVTSLNSDTVSLIDPSFREQTAIKVGQPADGHGVPRRRAVRRLPGRRLGACHRHSGAAMQVELPGRHRLRVARASSSAMSASLGNRRPADRGPGRRRRRCRRSRRARRISPSPTAMRCWPTSSDAAAPRAGARSGARSASPTAPSGRATASTSRCGRMSGRSTRAFRARTARPRSAAGLRAAADRARGGVQAEGAACR